MNELTIKFERNEIKTIKANAARQLREPENSARFFILKSLGFVDEKVFNPFAGTVMEHTNKEIKEFTT